MKAHHVAVIFLRRCRTAAVLASGLAGAVIMVQAAPDAAVFAAPPAAYAEAFETGSAPNDVLRTFYVEERVGVDRRAALVRVPLFFAPGECRDLTELAIRAGAEVDEDIPAQADDIRRGPDNSGIARAHLWFTVDLKAGEKRMFRVVRRAGATPARPVPPLPVEELRDAVKIATEAGAVEITAAGGLRGMKSQGAAWQFKNAGARPMVRLWYGKGPNHPEPEVILGAGGAEPQMQWSAGPIFTKVRLTWETAGARLQQEYRIPRHGREAVLTSVIFPGTGGAVKQHRLLAGELTSGAAEIRRVPAGVRSALRREHAYAVTGVAAGAGQPVLLSVPLVLGGSNGTWTAGSDGALALQGQGGLTRGGEGEQETLYAYWTEVRLVPVASDDPNQLWSAYRDAVQPLVAVVEEPGASIERLHAAMRDLMREMKPIGWRQEAGKALAIEDRVWLGKILRGVSPQKEGDAAALVRGAEKDTAKITQNGQRALREDEKGRAYGRLDPYHITYTQSAAAAVVALADAPPSIAAVNYAMAKAARDFGGRADRAGFPYIDCFSRTLNMQMGPVLFGLTAGAIHQDHDLVRFYRDLATAPPTLAVFGRGQRPYTGAPAGAPEQTDFLYQSICDFWLRTAELLANEDLQLHPLAYGRYVDCVDVLADLYHGVAAKDKAGATGFARSNFYRGQAHTHRWLGWSAAPFIRLLQDPAEKAAVGLTEATRYAQAMKGRWKNWPDLTFYEFADILTRQLGDRYRAPARLGAIASVETRRRANGTELSWAPVAGAAEYRVYRGDSDGGPYVWVNSPYGEHASPALTAPRFTDDAGKPSSVYVVVAVDEEGRPGAWPREF